MSEQRGAPCSCFCCSRHEPCTRDLGQLPTLLPAAGPQRSAGAIARNGWLTSRRITERPALTAHQGQPVSVRVGTTGPQRPGYAGLGLMLGMTILTCACRAGQTPEVALSLAARILRLQSFALRAAHLLKSCTVERPQPRAPAGHAPAPGAAPGAAPEAPPGSVQEAAAPPAAGATGRATGGSGVLGSHGAAQREPSVLELGAQEGPSTPISPFVGGGDPLQSTRRCAPPPALHSMQRSCCEEAAESRAQHAGMLSKQECAGMGRVQPLTPSTQRQGYAAAQMCCQQLRRGCRLACQAPGSAQAVLDDVAGPSCRILA